MIQNFLFIIMNLNIIVKFIKKIYVIFKIIEIKKFSDVYIKNLILEISNCYFKQLRNNTKKFKKNFYLVLIILLKILLKLMKLLNLKKQILMN